MPPKSTSGAPKAEAPTSGARRSTRSSAAPASAAKKEEDKKATNSKKRTADESAPKSATASKKAKAATTSQGAAPKSDAKAAPKSQPKSKGEKANGNASKKADTSSKKAEEKGATEEKKEEAPAEAAPDADGAVMKEGEKLPGIKLQNEEGKEVDVSKLAGKNGVVLFLYPKADTPGCTVQACGFRDSYDDIHKLGYDIYGLSKDTPNAQKKWKDKKELNYSFLCDPKSTLIKRLGAFVAPNNTKRSHFIFEKGSGKLVEIAIGVKPADDPGNVLKFIKAHHK